MPRIVGFNKTAFVVFFLISSWFPCLAGALAQFDQSSWTWMRAIEIPINLPDGFVAVGLESNLLQKCRPDLGDVRIVNTEGSIVPATILNVRHEEDPPPIPVRIHRTSRTPGKWTDIWIDKGSKIVTRGLLIQTSSQDFIRKVELRGSDNLRDSYVIKMDGLLASMVQPIALSSLDLMHPLNNFQFIHLRIIDGDNPPLKVDGVLCYQPLPQNGPEKKIDFRIIENKSKKDEDSAIIIGDLGDRRFPLTTLSVLSKQKEFIKKVEIFAASTPSENAWNKIGEGTIFRIRNEEAIKENVSIRINPELSRYIMLRLSGGSDGAINVEKINATAFITAAIFEYKTGTGYKVFYGNPKATADQKLKLSPLDLNRALGSEIFSVGEEHKNTAVAMNMPQKNAIPKNMDVSRIFIAISLLATLIVVFSIMLKGFSLRKNRRGKVFRTKINY